MMKTLVFALLTLSLPAIAQTVISPGSGPRVYFNTVYEGDVTFQVTPETQLVINNVEFRGSLTIQLRSDPDVLFLAMTNCTIHRGFGFSGAVNGSSIVTITYSTFIGKGVAFSVEGAERFEFTINRVTATTGSSAVLFARIRNTPFLIISGNDVAIANPEASYNIVGFWIQDIANSTNVYIQHNNVTAVGGRDVQGVRVDGNDHGQYMLIINNRLTVRSETYEGGSASGVSVRGLWRGIADFNVQFNIVDAVGWQAHGFLLAGVNLSDTHQVIIQNNRFESTATEYATSVSFSALLDPSIPPLSNTFTANAVYIQDNFMRAFTDNSKCGSCISANVDQQSEIHPRFSQFNMNLATSRLQSTEIFMVRNDMAVTSRSGDVANVGVGHYNAWDQVIIRLTMNRMGATSLNGGACNLRVLPRRVNDTANNQLFVILNTMNTTGLMRDAIPTAARSTPCDIAFDEDQFSTVLLVENVFRYVGVPAISTTPAPTALDMAAYYAKWRNNLYALQWHFAYAYKTELASCRDAASRYQDKMCGVRITDAHCIAGIDDVCCVNRRMGTCREIEGTECCPFCIDNTTTSASFRQFCRPEFFTGVGVCGSDANLTATPANPMPNSLTCRTGAPYYVDGNNCTGEICRCGRLQSVFDAYNAGNRDPEFFRALGAFNLPNFAVVANSSTSVQPAELQLGRAACDGYTGGVINNGVMIVDGGSSSQYLLHRFRNYVNLQIPHGNTMLVEAENFGDFTASTYGRLDLVYFTNNASTGLHNASAVYGHSIINKRDMAVNYVDLIGWTNVTNTGTFWFVGGRVGAIHDFRNYGNIFAAERSLNLVSMSSYGPIQGRSVNLTLEKSELRVGFVEVNNSAAPSATVNLTQVDIYGSVLVHCGSLVGQNIRNFGSIRVTCGYVNFSLSVNTGTVIVDAGINGTICAPPGSYVAAPGTVSRPNTCPAALVAAATYTVEGTIRLTGNFSGLLASETQRLILESALQRDIGAALGVDGSFILITSMAPSSDTALAVSFKVRDGHGGPTQAQVTTSIENLRSRTEWLSVTSSVYAADQPNITNALIVTAATGTNKNVKSSATSASLSMLVGLVFCFFFV